MFVYLKFDRLQTYNHIIQKDEINPLKTATWPNTTYIIPYLTLPYLTSGVDRLLHLSSAEAVSARPNARPRM